MVIASLHVTQCYRDSDRFLKGQIFMHVLIYCTAIYWSCLPSNDICTSVQLTTTADVSLNGYMVAPREDTGAPLGPDMAYVGSWESGTDIKLLCNGVSTFYTITSMLVTCTLFASCIHFFEGSCLLHGYLLS